MVAPLVLAGIGCAVVAPPGDPVRYSRRVDVVGWADPRVDPGALLELLLTWGASQEQRPVLFYQSDHHALFVSRHREELAVVFRFIVAEEALLEDLLDKLRFRELAERLDLPVPVSQVLDPRVASPGDLVLRPPVLIKPSSRSDESWVELEPAGKAIRVSSSSELMTLWPRLVRFGSSVLLQQLIAGPETCIVSYHVYVNVAGQVVTEFTGRKVRTKPVEFGRSTAVTITDSAGVKEVGRQIIGRLNLRGVAKLDFKVDPVGRLWLLEVNPRYTLWFHPAALAGVNVPAMVWADLVGDIPPPAQTVRPGVNWCSPWDLQAARLAGLSSFQWLRWARHCEARSMMDWRDPRPFLRLCVIRLSRFVKSRLAR
jgi:predicted ATP-grasp superfamily ATP-dependent carboligase